MSKEFGYHYPGSESGDAERYIEKHFELKALIKEIREEEARLDELYLDLVPLSKRSSLRMLSYGAKSLESYKMAYIACLENSYNVYDSSHAVYPELLKAIQVNNPEWLKQFVDDHEVKLKASKVGIYPLEKWSG